MIQIETQYGNDEFVHIDWHTSQFFTNPDAQARATYYSVGGVPDVFFDGYDHVVGGGSPMYSTYHPIVVNHFADLAKLSITASVTIDAGAGTGTIDAQVLVAAGETIANPGECRIRCAILENEITHCCDSRGNDQWETIGRDMLPVVTLTAANGGETQDYDQVFTLNPTWNPDNLHAIVFVQRETNKRLLNSTWALSPFNVEVETLDPLAQRIDGPAVPFTWDQEVTYTGSVTDDVVVTIDQSTLPVGWSAELEYNATTYASSFTIPAMTSNQTEAYVVRIFPNGPPGVGDVAVRVEPDSQPAEAITTDLHGISNTPAILLVDDDGGAAHDVAYKNAITAAGFPSVTHPVTTLGTPVLADLNLYDAVVWTTGESETSTIDAAADLQLRQYLDAGGRLFLSSHGILDERSFTTFSINYLRVSNFAMDAGAATGTGTAGDPIGDGLALTLAPPFPDKADKMTPNSGAVKWLASPAAAPQNAIGIRYDTGTFRTVFMCAAFEGLSTVAADPNNQASVMDRILDWLLPTAFTGVNPGLAAAATGLTLSPSAPNPFTSSTSVRFALPQSGAVNLSVFDVAGRRVATLVDGAMEAGSHAIDWNGRDASGRAVASGVYLMRLESAGETVTRETVRMK